MPAYMKLGDIKGEATDRYRKLTVDSSFLPYPGALGLVDTVRKAHPAGVDYILIGLLPVPGYKITTTSKGATAILIGLLLPAVQRIDAPSSADGQLLRGALKPTGALGAALGDGSVRHLFGSKPNLQNISGMDDWEKHNV